MRKRKPFAAFLASFVAFAAMLVAPAPASATDYSVDMRYACQLSHGAGWQDELTYPAQGAWGWRCWVPPWGAVRKDVYVQKYCDAVGQGTAVALDSGNPYSWRCRT